MNANDPCWDSWGDTIKRMEEILDAHCRKEAGSGITIGDVAEYTEAILNDLPITEESARTHEMILKHWQQFNVQRVRTGLDRCDTLGVETPSGVTDKKEN